MALDDVEAAFWYYQRVTSTLDQLRVGARARVEQISGDKRYRLRLLEMGLTPGTEVRIVRVAPLGDPLTIDLRGSRISLRRADAAAVRVHSMSEAAETVAEPVQFRVALAGNPNSGKSTLFNALTGANAHVGNYPGITVARVKGRARIDGAELELVDVPGTYSLVSRSRDEQVAIDELLGNTGDGLPDAVVVVMDATTIQRGIYLLLQIQELAVPTVAAVNMMDEARAQGITVDTEALARHLGIPVVGIAARSGEGLADLRRELLSLLRAPPRPDEVSWHWQPSQDLEAHLTELGEHLEGLVGKNAPPARKRAVALWCLLSLAAEDDLEGIAGDLRAKVLAIRADMESHGHDLDLEVTQARYQHIDEDSSRYLRLPARGKTSLSDRIDNVLVHPVLGTLIFLAVMALVFGAIFDLAAPLVNGLERLVAGLQDGVRGALPRGLASEVLTDGVLAGVGSVIVFLPQILILFLLITLLEGSGYMARAAFVVDRLMFRLGLTGQAFVPMISGFACCVPAILATRTIASTRDRLLTIMVLPLISCSARLPIYTLIIGALFPADRPLLGPIRLGMAMLFAVYLISTLLSVLAAAVLGRTVLRGRPTPLLLELPPYRLPSLRVVLRTLLDRSLTFLKTAGTVILIASVVLWALLSFPRDRLVNDTSAAPLAAEPGSSLPPEIEAQRRAKRLEHSYAGRLGKSIEPMIEPLGFDWRIGVGLIGSLAAREVFVSTMGLIHGVSGEETSAPLREIMRRERRADGSRAYSPLTGVSLLVFFMIALQCISTFAVARQETRSWRWPIFQFAYLLVLAYLASLLVYQGGRALGFG